MYPFPKQGFYGNPFGKFDSGASEFFYWEDLDSSCNVYPWNNSGVVVISDFFGSSWGIFCSFPLWKNKKHVTKLATNNAKKTLISSKIWTKSGLKFGIGSFVAQPADHQLLKASKRYFLSTSEEALQIVHWMPTIAASFLRSGFSQVERYWRMVTWHADLIFNCLGYLVVFLFHYSGCWEEIWFTSWHFGQGSMSVFFFQVFFFNCKSSDCSLVGFSKFVARNWPSWTTLGTTMVKWRRTFVID